MSCIWANPGSCVCRSLRPLPLRQLLRNGDEPQYNPQTPIHDPRLLGACYIPCACTCLPVPSRQTPEWTIIILVSQVKKLRLRLHLLKVTSFSGELDPGPSNSETQRFQRTLWGLNSLAGDLGSAGRRKTHPRYIRLRESLDSFSRPCSSTLPGKVLFENTGPPLLA